MKRHLLISFFLVFSFHSLRATVLIDSTGAGGFELGSGFAANGWTVVNGTQTNKWFCNTPSNPAVPFAGTNCAYISNNAAGSTYNYSISSSSVVHFYRDVTFPASDSSFFLSFEFKGNGEGAFDYLQVFLVPTSTIPVAGTFLTGPILTLNLDSSWQHISVPLPCGELQGTTQRIIFSWTNDGSLGTQPPAAIDNISLITSPAAFNCDNLIGSGVTHISSLPYNSGPGTTCGNGNDLTGTNTIACINAYYFGGEDNVWAFTPSVSGKIEIAFSSTTAVAPALILYEGCPLSVNCPVSMGSCIAFATPTSTNYTFSACVVNGATYYLLLDNFPPPGCNNYDNLNISAPIPLDTCAYTHQMVSYVPDDFGGTELTLTDDIFSGPVPIGFDFCFYGQIYSNLIISSNAYLSFDTTYSGNHSPWPTVPIPTLFPPEIHLSVMGPWVDINPALGGHIRYQTLGATPNRRFIVSYDSVPDYQCDTLIFTGQIILNETTNTIENRIGHYAICPTWNLGNAVQGLNNDCNADTISGRNNTNFTIDNETIIYTPNGCCSPSTNISAIQNPQSAISISPNPFTNTLSLSGTKAKGEAVLYDVMGKEMLRQQTTEGETRLNTSQLAAGFYMLSYTAGEKRENIKVIKAVVQ